MLVADDHHLFAVLAQQAVQQVQSGAEVNQIFTTVSWYYRLARAANDITFIGALSRRIEALHPDGRAHVLALLDELPETIGLVSARVLVPVMAKLRTPRLNHLAAKPSPSQSSSKDLLSWLRHLSHSSRLAVASVSCSTSFRSERPRGRRAEQQSRRRAARTASAAP